MKLKRIIQSEIVQNAIAWMAARYAVFVARTTSWQILGEPQLESFVSGKTPFIVVFWHEAMPSMPVFWLTARRRKMQRPALVLASRHRDGQLIGKIVQNIGGIGLISGSSSRGGPAGLRAMLNALSAGTHIGLTPDGPRGPRRVCAPGVAQLAALSGIPVLPCAAYIGQARQLNTWDQMRMPLPFSRGVLVMKPMIAVPRDGWADALVQITDSLNTAMAEAERLP